MTEPAERFLKISEIFRSVQGEGSTAGAPSTFVRLGLCNLRCRWCDTPYTWDFDRFDYGTEIARIAVPEIAERIERLGSDRVVVTGGEPLLQQRPLGGLLDLLPRSSYVEIETNGTVAPTRELAGRVDQWNVSVKLENSGEPRTRRVRPDAVFALRATGRAWLKLVLAETDEAEEARALASELGFTPDRVLLMAEGADRSTYRRRAPAIASMAKKLGFGVSPRLHIERFDGKRGL